MIQSLLIIKEVKNMSTKEQLSKLPDDKVKKGLLKLILKNVDVSEENYQKSFKETYKVNLDVCGVKGYQIYEPDKYISKDGESLEDSDVTLMFKDIDHIRGLLQGENIDIEMGRNSKNVVLLNRKNLFMSTRMGTDERNAQVLMAKLPIFDPILKNFGTSRLVRPLRDGPEFISPVEKGEIESLMKKMLSEAVDITDEAYKKNFQGQVLTVNWDIDGKIASQIFEETGYNYVFGKNTENADITIMIKNPEYAKRFLQQIPTNYAPGLDSDENLLIYIKIPVLSIQFKNPDDTVYSLARLPFFRSVIQKSDSGLPTEEKKEEKKDERENYMRTIPVNLPLGEYENVVVPYKVFEHFINKASNIVLRTCPCRERWDCKNHDVSLGCMFMGDDTKNMALSPDEGYVATKEQALEHLKNAMADGLVPLIGRNVAEAEDGHGIRDTGKFFGGCFCCECCCIGVKTRQYVAPSSMGGGDSGKLEGWEMKVDYEKCDGCETCINTCPYNLRIIIDGKSSVDPAHCVGCGRCVDVCPNGAISIDIEDPEYIDKLITKLESVADVTDQTINN